MSTDIGGPAPSMSSDPESEGDIEPGLHQDAASVRMRRELRRQLRASHRLLTGGGKHARTDVESRPLPADYVPRHALVNAAPGAGTQAAPEDRAAVPVERFITFAEPEQESPRKRERVVLSERRRPVRPVRTVVDVRELTGVGDLLRSNLIRAQLGLSLRIGGIAAMTLGLLPLMFALFPTFGRYEVFNIRLPWLLLGALVYPFLLLLGWLHARSAERLEQSFTEHVRD